MAKMAEALAQARRSYFRDKVSEKLRVIITYEYETELPFDLDKMKEELKTYGELYRFERKLGENKVKVEFLDFVEHNSNLAFVMRRAGGHHIDVSCRVEEYYKLEPGDRIIVDLYDDINAFLGGQLLAEVVEAEPMRIFLLNGGRGVWGTTWDLHTPNVQVMGMASPDHRIMRDDCPACMYRRRLLGGYRT